MAQFNHKNYILDGDRIVRKEGAQGYKNEELEKLEEAARYLEAKIIEDYNFNRIQIPEDDDTEISTSILASPEWTSKKNLLLIIQNQSKSELGIFSRGVLSDHGFSKGSWLPYIERATREDYGILILRPNTNFVGVQSGEKVAIKGSESPEIHALNVWSNIVPRAENDTKVSLLSFGNGASLSKDLFLKDLLSNEKRRICAFLSIAASRVIEQDDDAETKSELGKIAVNIECSSFPKGTYLKYKEANQGCSTVSLGLPQGMSKDQWEASPVDALSVSTGIDAVFEFLNIVKNGSSNPSKRFVSEFSEKCGLSGPSATITVNPNPGDLPPPTPAQPNLPLAPPPKQEPKSFFSRMLGGSGKGDTENTIEVNNKLTVADFDLLKIVGKGAFGKVMLVRKKGEKEGSNIYAMKVLKKSVVAAKGQIEHTRSEREILFAVKHPYIVHLRYAFQSEDKLYLVTDYYNGGTLFYHLRKSRCFSEERAKFYGAELLSALSHLHSLNIIYRDLKLENILMDHQGHIALTDFGLSKQNIDSTGGATTFCGTAEYIAPELLKGQKYGHAVDWWSFGILLYEMMLGRTPFFDRNRKLMFYRIINTEPTFSSNTFSPAASACIQALLNVNDSERLGSGPNGGEAIMKTEFFSVIDFDKLLKRQLVPPFKPEVVNEFDTKYVPKAYLTAEVKDSFDEPTKGKKKETNPKFEAFTYQGNSALEG